MTNRMLFINGEVYSESAVLPNGAVAVEDGKITAVYQSLEEISDDIRKQSELIDLNGALLLPGFIDVHVHGGGGFDTMKSSTEPGSIDGLSRFMASHGTTSFLPTTLTDEAGRLVEVVSEVSRAMSAGTGGADVLGVHLEGPFLNPIRSGAQNPDDMRTATKEELGRLLEASGETIRLITLAPELPGAMELIGYLTEKGVTVSIGHSDATYEIVQQAVAHGATHVTHLFNGMSPLHHREPGVAGSALMLDELTVELICDGLHVREELIGYVFRVKPKERVILVTDAMEAAGLPDGEYMLGKLPVVMKCNRVTLKEGGNLAGSALTMDQALRNALKFTGRTLEEILPALTLNPARQIGVNHRKGSILAGKDADFVVMGRNLELLQTYVRGHEVYHRSKTEV
ncbi:N-acetylglucosamine-6-phosphate deacetylase [Paenibacillus gansuensis]|uniref:N-acetylglucosamine-6-phosphate deacetylase n=1 Tax=Paenibacillus gansuensis TaxID=306542 RepID=A0ABW5PC90_9BACL